MRLDKDGTVVLSERNLWSLLTKLYTDGSARAIVGGIDAPGVRVSAEKDDEHYGDRPYGPGPMHPVTEKLVARLRETIDDPTLETRIVH